MGYRNKISILVAVGAALCALILPARTLFTGGGFLAWSIRQPQTAQMAAEALAVFLILLICLMFVRGRGKRIAAAAAVCLVFCWIHVTFLPMALAGFYAGYLVLLGRWARLALAGGRQRRAGAKEACDALDGAGGPLFGVPADFLLGAGLVIAVFCLLSAAGLGGIPRLRAISAVSGLAVYGWAARGLWRGRGGERGTAAFWREGGSGLGRPRAVPSVLLAFILTMILIQVGRMNLTLDFDTLWYGVRSEYILDSGGGIYENPGLVGMVYVYSKGLEVLTLPLCDLASHSYLLAFNVWVTVLGLFLVYGCARFFMGRNFALLSAALVSAVPGVMNMSISAKPDNITWLLQLIMIFYLLHYVGADRRGGDRPAGSLILAAGAYLLSLTMKPTSLVFSTAVFGMAGLYLICSGTLSLRAPARRWLLLLPEAAALLGIWGRTMMITGMPVTSVFTSIFARLGFEMKYPFATGSLPQNWQEESNFHVLARRLYQMLLAPEGKDMSHVILAWGTSLIFFLAVCLAVLLWSGRTGRGTREGREEDRREAGKPPVPAERPMAEERPARKRGPGGRGLTVFLHVIFWPFLAVNLVSLVMLYQVDGNYFTLLYTLVIWAACAAFSRAGHWKNRAVCQVCLALLAPLFAFNALITLETNWAWSLGFSEIRLLNKGRVNHEAAQREEMIRKGNARIWEILAGDPGNRVIAFGDHPFCLAFPCNVQSYKDITAPWGNVELVNSAEAFEDYMEYAGTDYVYVEAGFIGESSWSWSYGLVQDMIADGTLTDLIFEEGNVLARVDLESRADLEGPADPGEQADLEGREEPEGAADRRQPGSGEAAWNLEQFLELYKTSDSQP